MIETPTPTERTRIKRPAQRGHYGRATSNAILDEAFIRHVRFVLATYLDAELF